MMAVAIVVIGLMVMLQQLTISYRESDLTHRSSFAFEKAAALLTELQNGADLGTLRSANDLYQLVDSTPNPVLTTRRDGEDLAVEPDHPMSGNSRRQGHWQWGRQILVQPHDQPGLYYATANVLHWEGTRWSTVATQAQLISLLPDADAPVHEFDVYVLACGESPSLLGNLQQLRTDVDNAVSALQQSSQARVRLHWITQLGYGRDACYAPFVNAASSNAAAADWAYWYPGQVDATLTNPLYDAGLLLGLHRTESGLAGAAAQPFAIADRNNHCLRTPAARALFDALVAQQLASDDAPPLQVLLDRMLETPERYRGAIFLNLHGSGLPMPPLRDFADAAKEPQAHAGVRVVTHATRLWTPRDPDGDGDAGDSSPVELRVYAFRTAPGDGSAVLAQPITLVIPGAVDLAAAANGGAAPTMQIRRLQGGINPANGAATGAGRTYSGFDSPEGVPPTSPSQPAEMWYETGFVGGSKPYTWIKLHNTPLQAPPVGNRGLAVNARLYGYDYIPSPVTADGDFAIDLATDATDPRQPRNTARWRIRLLPSLLAPSRLGNQDHVLQVTTRIGADLDTGVRFPVAHQPCNRSDTWAWWTHSPSAVPASERFQLLGDPRHCPYADLMRNGATNANGYNWHFDDLRALLQDARGLWPCFDPDRLQDGFGHTCRADAPRGLQLWRQALQACGGVLVSPGGAVASYLLLGGDITAAGSDGHSRAVQLPAVYRSGLLPLGGIDTCQQELILGANSDASWWAKPWLGELFPDTAFASWFDSGNLPLGANGATCQWRAMTAATNLPFGTSFPTPSSSALGNRGSVMLLDCGTATTTFRCDEPLLLLGATTATPLPPLQSIAGSCSTTPPTLPAWSTLALAAGVPTATEAYGFQDAYPRGTATLRESLLESSKHEPVAGIVDFATDPTARAFLVPLGAGHDGHAAPLIATALLAGLRAVHTAGLPGLPGRLTEVPQLSLIEPPASFTAYDPTALTLRWQLAFTRYDGEPYTAAHDPSFRESERNLVYRVLYSADAGNSWSSVLTGQPTAPGVFPADLNDSIADAGEGNETFVVATPAETFPMGEYRFRVECHDLDRHSHCSSHQVRVVIRRN